MSDETKDTRLPPPAFPPGSRRHLNANSDARHGSAARPGDSGTDAYIAPDDPMPPRRDKVDDAFISPDDPMPERRQDAAFGAFISPDDPMPSRALKELEPEEGIVTGMGDDPHLDPEELVGGGDPHVMEVMGAVERLAAALKRKGEAGLRTTPQMTRFEATLRGYCVGYIAGRRAEDEAEQRDYAPFTGPDVEA